MTVSSIGSVGDPNAVYTIGETNNLTSAGTNWATFSTTDDIGCASSISYSVTVPTELTGKITYDVSTRNLKVVAMSAGDEKYVGPHIIEIKALG